jgi:hypothetical protein
VTERPGRERRRPGSHSHPPGHPPNDPRPPLRLRLLKVPHTKLRMWAFGGRGDPDPNHGTLPYPSSDPRTQIRAWTPPGPPGDTGKVGFLPLPLLPVLTHQQRGSSPFPLLNWRPHGLLSLINEPARLISGAVVES